MHGEEVEKKGLTILKEVSSSSLDAFEREINEALKSLKYNDLDDMVYNMELTFN